MNGKAGRLFQRNNPEDFSNQLAEIMQNREKRAQYVRMADENIHRFMRKNQMIISKNPQFTGISARQQLEFTTHLLLTD